MSVDSDFTCSITMMYPICLPTVFLQKQIQQIQELIHSVQHKYQNHTETLRYLDVYRANLDDREFSLSSLARMTCILKTCIQIEEEHDFGVLFKQIASQGTVSFEQLLDVHEYIGMESSASFLILLLQWYSELSSQYTENVQQTWKKYVFTKNLLIKMKLRARIDTTFNTHGRQWTFIADLDDAKQQLIREQKILRAWKVQALLLKQVEMEYCQKEKIAVHIFTAKTTQNPQYHSSWEIVRPLLQQYLDEKCTNQFIPTLIAQLCGYLQPGE